MIDLIIRVANFDYKIQKMPGRLMYIEAQKKRSSRMGDSEFIDKKDQKL